MTHKCNVLFYKEGDKVLWACKNRGLRPTKDMPLHQNRCWHYKCPGRNLQQIDPLNPTAQKPTQTKCAYEKCDKPRLEERKYCSNVCMKRKHRRDYKIRKNALPTHKTVPVSARS